MWGRHGKHRTADSSAVDPERASTADEDTGFDGLEGGFEQERRRAAAASHERIKPYGHEDEPPSPDTRAPLTHP